MGRYFSEFRFAKLLNNDSVVLHDRTARVCGRVGSLVLTGTWAVDDGNKVLFFLVTEKRRLDTVA